MVKPRPDQKADYGGEAQGHTFFARIWLQASWNIPHMRRMYGIFTYILAEVYGFHVGKYSHLGSFLRMLK